MLLNNKNIFVIAEIGHNHMGDIKEAFNLIESAKKCGADAVKFQKRDNKFLYTKKFYDSLYDNPNSYGRTYGEHREFLEFGIKEYSRLIKFSKKIGIKLFATPFDFKSVKFLEKLKMPFYKIASADLTNTPLQIEIAKTGKPIIISTGGGTFKDIDRAVKNIKKINKKIIILHCTASYPAKIEDMNLSIISRLKKKYKNITIGLSDHENGIDAGVVAYMLGARVFEKHFTLNRANKGTDHSFSLEPQGLQKFIRNLKRVELLMGNDNKKLLKSEKKPLYKMKKSIVANKDLIKGSKITYKDLDFKSPGGGLEPFKYSKIIGKKLKKDLKKDEFILQKNIK
tara:strand:+ start:415 stop:1434 length:1020 start_codon:yes stop_codon:yes gene_type:complete